MKFIVLCQFESDCKKKPRIIEINIKRVPITCTLRGRRGELQAPKVMKEGGLTVSAKYVCRRAMHRGDHAAAMPRPCRRSQQASFTYGAVDMIPGEKNNSWFTVKKSRLLGRNATVATVATVAF